MGSKPHLFRLYAAGLACTFVGAWLTQVSGSFLPLSLGASVTLMCTFQVIKSIRAKPAPRNGSRPG
jgi:hypothetical protein